MSKWVRKLRGKWNVYFDPKFSFVRKKLISNNNFTIICNNCWAGYVYRHFGIPYLSPTIGLYFYAEDFIKLCKNIQYYFNECSLRFIPYTESKYKDDLIKKGQENIPIGKLDDIEIIFLHYGSEDEAQTKWDRRVKRINYDNIIFKFSQMNNCSKSHIEQFDELDVRKKFMFVSSDHHKYKSSIVIQESGDIKDDTIFFSNYINIVKLINCETCCGNDMRGKHISE